MTFRGFGVRVGYGVRGGVCSHSKVGYIVYGVVEVRVGVGIIHIVSLGEHSSILEEHIVGVGVSHLRKSICYVVC